MIVKKDSTDITTYVNLVDSAAGTPETALTITNIDATYTRMRAAAVKNDLTALAAVDSAHADNKGIEVDATNAPGLYRIDWPDAAFATGADKVILTVTCAGCAPAHLICELVNYSSQDGVRLGLTALPNAAADAAGGLPISDAGGLDVDAILSRIGTPANLGGGTATLAGNMQDIEAQTDDIGAAGAGLTAVPWNAAWDAEVESEVNDALVVQRLDELLAADSDIDGVAPPTVGSVFHELMSKTAGSFTYDQTTDSNEAIKDALPAAAPTAAAVADAVWDEAQADHVGAGSFGLIASEIADILVDTAEIGAAGAGLTNINLPDQTMNITGNITGNLSGSVGSVTGAVGSVTGAVGSVTGAVGSVGAGGITAASFGAGAIDAAAIAANAIGASELAADAATEIADAVLSRNVSNVEASAAEHTLCTVVLAMLENAISGTTLTIKRTDGATTHATKTLTVDAAADPITGIA